MPAQSTRCLTSAIGTMLGVLALLLTLVQFAAGPFEPKKSIERSIAEIAVNISKEVLKVRRGEPAERRARSYSIDDWIKIAAILAAGLGIVLGVIAFVRREDHRMTVASMGLGASAVVFQFFVWAALVMAGLVLIWIVVTNLDGILSSG